MRTKQISKRIVKLNHKIEGGYAVIYCHPMFQFGTWMISVEKVLGEGRVIIGGGFNPAEAFSKAENKLAAISLLHPEALTATGAIPLTVVISELAKGTSTDDD